MEKRFTLALVLSLLVLVLWQLYWAPRQQPLEEKPTEEAQKEPEQPEKPAPPKEEPKAPKPQKPEIPPEKVQLDSLSNDAMRLTFTNVGATLRQAELMDFHARADDGDEPLKLLVPSSRHLETFRLDDVDYPEMGLDSSLWDVERSEDGRTLTYSQRFARPAGEGQEVAYVVTKVYTLPPGDARHLHARIKVRAEGEGDRSITTTFGLLVSGGVFQEPGTAMNPPHSALHPYDGDTKIVNLQQVKDEQDILATLDGGRKGGVRYVLGDGVRYLADLGNYLGAFLLLQKFPKDVTGTVHRIQHEQPRDDLGASEPRTCTVVLFEDTLEQGQENEYEALLYLGPVQSERISADLGGTLPADTLEALGDVYGTQLGWASGIARVVLSVLRGLHAVVGSWGWSIVLLTFCVRLLLFPINRKSQGAMLRQQEAMARIKPRIDALKKKYEGNSRKFAEEQMKLMKQENVPLLPLGGCLPIFLQIPVFFGLFAALRASLELRQAPWLWVADLSQPDHLVRFEHPVANPLSCLPCFCIPGGAGALTGFHLLPILMTIAWVLNSYFMPKPETSNPQMEQQRKMMMFMPLAFGLFMYNYAAALSLYWLTSSLFGIVESRIIKKVWPVKKPEDRKPRPAAT